MRKTCVKAGFRAPLSILYESNGEIDYATNTNIGVADIGVAPTLRKTKIVTYSKNKTYSGYKRMRYINAP